MRDEFLSLEGLRPARCAVVQCERTIITHQQKI